MIRIPLLLLPALLLGAPTLAQGSAERILLVDIDDVGWDLLGTTPTPALDRLSNEGRLFTRFHSAPLCSPSRVRMLLGAYGSRPEILCGHFVGRMESYEVPLTPFQPLPDLVGEHGYTSAKVGKWHMAPDDRPTHPNEAGWGHYMGAMGNPAGHGSVDGEGYFYFRKVTDGVVRYIDGKYLTVDETDDAVRCVEAGFDLISVSYHAPHKPAHKPPPEFWYDGEPSSVEEKVRAALHALDSELGRLLDAAIQREYTILVFSDNGTAKLIDGEKGRVTPPSVFVPMWALGPGIVPGKDDSLVDCVDLYATVADLFGVPQNTPDLQGPDSKSFAHRLYGFSGPTRTYLYAEQWRRNGIDPRFELPPNALWKRSVRTKRWSLTRDDADEVGEHFYDRVGDLREEHDLIEVGLKPFQRAAYLDLIRFLDKL